MAQPISSEVCSLRRFRIRRGWLAKFFNTLFLVFATTRVLHFPSQENFLVVIENKIHFFLSLSQLISSLKPAGEGSHKACVNKL